MRDSLDRRLAAARFVILDGGLATELEARGCDLAGPLWSAKVLVEQPELVRAVHRAYVEAGAEIITTATYQATLPGLCAAGLTHAHARTVLRRGVALAREAAAGTEVLVAASIGSYGAYLADGSEYRGDYGLDCAALVDFHRDRVIELCAATPDLLAFETIPSAVEAAAIAELLREITGPRAWVSFSLQPSPLGSTDDPLLSDGTSLRDAVAPLLGHPRIAAIGVNCVAPTAVLAALEALSEVAPDLPLLAYPNAGEGWSGGRWSGAAIELEPFINHAIAWVQAGARVLGGCCRTSPAHVEALVRMRAQNFPANPSPPPPGSITGATAVKP